KLSPAVPSPLPSSDRPPAEIWPAKAVSVYRPSASEPNSVAAPVKFENVTTVTPPTTFGVAVNSTAAPSLARVSVKAALVAPAKVTVVLNVTASELTRDRWTAPAFTVAPLTVGAGAAAGGITKSVTLSIGTD